MPTHSLQFCFPPMELVTWFDQPEHIAFCVDFLDALTDYLSAFIQTLCAVDPRTDFSDALVVQI